MLSRAKKGFTIIEVVIVLVIGAIIMLMVFLVVPALQRSQRDGRRQNDARRFLSAAEQYAANHSGKYPSSQTDANNTVKDYIKEKFEDPNGGNYLDGGTAITGPSYKSAAANVNTSGSQPRMIYAQNSTCDKANPQNTAAVASSPNRVAISVYQENGGKFCLSN